MKQQSSVTTDLAAVAQLLSLFLCVALTAFSPDRLLQNLIAVTVIFAVMLFAYFSTPTATLVVDLVLIFLYMSFLIYDMLSSDRTHGALSYLWAILLPAVTFSTSVMHSEKNALERSYRTLRVQAEHLAAIDAETGLKTLPAYAADARMLQGLARRHDLQVLLLVWGLRYEGQLRRMLGREELRQVVRNVSEVMRECLRTEDALYLLEREPILWGALALIRPGGETGLKQRLRQRAESIDLTPLLGRRAPKVELRFGSYAAEQGGSPPEQMRAGAVAQMQYDVG